MAFLPVLGTIGSLASAAGSLIGGASSMLNPAKGAGFQTAAQPRSIDSGQVQNAAGLSQADIGQQQAFVNALQGQGGIQNQSNVYNQLAGVAAGTGPNPAQAMLNQATGANVANQAALMAGQRGTGANAGLLARQAGMQGGALQQQAVGQGATMQANQSLNALGQMGGIAGQQIGQQSAGLNALNQQQQAEQQQLQNAYNTQGAQELQAAGINAGIAQGNQTTQRGLLGGALGGVGTALAALTPAKAPATPASQAATKEAALPKEVQQSLASGGEVGESRVVKHLMGFAKGGKVPGNVPAMVSPGERYLNPSEVKKVADGKKAPEKAGKKIPGKAKVKGDSLKNDTVPMTLKEGGIVLPKSVMESKNPHWEAHKFVQAIMAKKGLRK